MKDQYILIDFENVQPDDLSPLCSQQFKVIIFLGALQTKLPTDLVLKLKQLGSNVDYVQAPRAGKNALDFHVAYYLGRLATTNLDAAFHIISKDTGFDPLIQHVQALGVSCQRLPALSSLARMKKSLPQSASDSIQKVAAESKPRPAGPDNVGTLNGRVQTNGVSSQRLDSLSKPPSPKVTATRPASDAAQKVIAALAKWGSAKPKNIRTLRSSMANLLRVQPGEPFVDRVLRELEQCGALSIAALKVTYRAMK